MVMANNRYIVMVGCGSLGSQLANSLSRDGNSVVMIDKNEESFKNLSADFSGFRINGDVTQMSVLKEAKLNKADLFIATTHEDNVNLMVAQVAQKIFTVPHVLARVFDPGREEVYAQLGIETISPSSLAAEMFLRAIAKGKSSENGVKP